MKFFSALVLFIIFSLTSVFAVHAQAAESIWLEASTTSFKTGETVTATIHAASATLIQGFTAQIRYDPECLLPVNGTSPIVGMNPLAVPQESGLVDAIFSSTEEQVANGVLAEIHFTALKGCQTNLSLETASLAIRNQEGFAAPLPNVSTNQQPLALNIDSEVGIPQPTVSGESVLPLVPTIFPEPEPVNWWIVAFIVLLCGIAITTVIVVYRLSRQ